MFKKSIFIGIFLIVIAMSILANALGFTFKFPIFKALICCFLLSITVDGLKNKRPFEILVPIAIVVSILLGVFNINTKVGGFPLIASAVLISAGIGIMRKSSNRVEFIDEDYREAECEYEETCDEDSCYEESGDKRSEASESQSGEERVYSKKITPIKNYSEENRKISFDTIFSSARRNINSVFESAEINTVFGDSGIYFNEAVPYNGNATIETDAVFGSIKVYVPADWQLNVKTESVAGSVKVHGEPAVSEYSPEVTLKGAAVFGSIDIYYV